MLDILKNFDAAGKGEKLAVGSENKDDMKTILESFNKVAECGTDMTEMPMPAPAQGQPVTVSVTASGKDNVADLIAMMQAAAGIEQHVDIDSHNVSAQDADMARMKQAIMGQEESVEEEDYANEPDEEYKDHNFMTKDLSGGINRRKPKGSERVKDPAVESIKERLWAALNEKKS